MNPMKGFKGISRTLGTIFMIITFLLFFSLPGQSLADDRQEANHLVEKARLLMDNFMIDKNLQTFRDLIKKAKGVFIIPELLKGAFIVGASGGSGLLLVKDKKSGTWKGPAFYTVGGASFGLQIGGEASEVVILAMTSRGVSSFLSNSLKLGADVSVAVGPEGIGASAATANLSADLISFSRSKGLYGGVSLDGSLVAVRDGLNQAFYSHKASPTDILIRGAGKNPKAQELIEEVAGAAKK